MIGNHKHRETGIRCILTLHRFLIPQKQEWYNEQINEIKHEWLPRVIMAEDFDTAWQEYMDAYNACSPQILMEDLQQEVMRRICR